MFQSTIMIIQIFIFKNTKGKGVWATGCLLDMNENPWLGYRNRPKRIKKYNHWYSFLKGCIIMKLDAYVYIHVIYNTRGSSIVIHCWTTVQDVKKYIMHWILVYNEDNLYAIRREAIPSIYSYSQLKSRIYHIAKCQGCTVKQSHLPLFHCWTQTYMYLVCLIN